MKFCSTHWEPGEIMVKLPALLEHYHLHPLRRFSRHFHGQWHQYPMSSTRRRFIHHGIIQPIPTHRSTFMPSSTAMPSSEVATASQTRMHRPIGPWLLYFLFSCFLFVFLFIIFLLLASCCLAAGLQQRRRHKSVPPVSCSCLTRWVHHSRNIFDIIIAG